MSVTRANSNIKFFSSPPRNFAINSFFFLLFWPHLTVSSFEPKKNLNLIRRNHKKKKTEMDRSLSFQFRNINVTHQVRFVIFVFFFFEFHQGQAMVQSGYECQRIRKRNVIPKQLTYNSNGWMGKRVKRSTPRLVLYIRCEDNNLLQTSHVEYE